MELINDQIERYARDHTKQEPDLIRELIEASEKELEHIDMISGRVVGRFLAMMVRIAGAKRILEIGTFTGYSALSMAEALPDDGELITCEYNERYEGIARSFFRRSAHGHKIRLMMGPALETIEQLTGTFDLVYLDADKVNYPDYYKMVLPRINRGGLMITDNVLWNGSVLQPEDDKARAIDKLNKMIQDDEQVENVLLTVRDGLQVVRKVAD